MLMSRVPISFDCSSVSFEQHAMIAMTGLNFLHSFVLVFIRSTTSFPALTF
jgi:hypothetical protein